MKSMDDLDTMWRWNDIIDHVFDIKNDRLIEICSHFLDYQDNTKENMNYLHDKFITLKLQKPRLDGELLEKSNSVNWDALITHDQLFDIFPISFLEEYDMNMVRRWKLKNIIGE